MSYTVQEAATAFLRAKHRRLAVTSFKEYQRVVKKLVDDLGADREVADLEPPHGTQLIEDFLDGRWADAPHSYNRNLSILRGLCKFLIQREHLHRDPCAALERARPERHARSVFSDLEIERIIVAARSPRDRIALRLMLIYGLRKGAITNFQLVCFDRSRRAISFKTKGSKFHKVPIIGDDLWDDLDKIEGHPGDYLLHRRGHPDQPLSPHGTHLWWYKRLSDAGIVEPGTTSGKRMHGARHTAGQRVLNKTGNLKAAQQLLGHASIQTTGDVYTDWDSDALRETMDGLDVA